MLTINTNNYSKLRRFRHICGMVARTITCRPAIFNLNINVTDLCNQKCPMCNARLDVKKTATLTAGELRKYLVKLTPHLPATATLSGGEPTLAKELPEMIDMVKDVFPYGVGLSSNLQGTNDRVRNNLVAALKRGIRISCSFDGFGEVADRQRGIKNAAANVIENIRFVTDMRKKLNSNSALIMHTVISDLNIEQIPDILDLSREYGWNHRVAPAQCLYYHKNEGEFTTLTAHEKLKQAIEQVLKAPNLRQFHNFVSGIVKYTSGTFKKYCPYITRGTRFMKVFLDPNGDISLCDREPIGNLNSESFSEIIKGNKYKEKLKKYKECRGCWTPCFVEPLMRAEKFAPWI